MHILKDEVVDLGQLERDEKRARLELSELGIILEDDYGHSLNKPNGAGLDGRKI